MKSENSVVRLVHKYSFCPTLFFALFALIPLLIYWYIHPPFRLQGTLIVSSIKSFGSGRSWKTMLTAYPFYVPDTGHHLPLLSHWPVRRREVNSRSPPEKELILCFVWISAEACWPRISRLTGWKRLNRWRRNLLTAGRQTGSGW